MKRTAKFWALQHRKGFVRDGCGNWVIFPTKRLAEAYAEYGETTVRVRVTVETIDNPAQDTPAQGEGDGR